MRKIKPIRIIIYLFLIIMAVIYLAPLLWVLIVAFKDNNHELMVAPFSLPQSPSFANFTFAWTAGKLGIATLNSFLVCTISLILSMGPGCR